jgi:hypothetical protein
MTGQHPDSNPSHKAQVVPPSAELVRASYSGRNRSTRKLPAAFESNIGPDRTTGEHLGLTSVYESPIA